MWGGRPQPPPDDGRAKAFWIQECPQRRPALTHAHMRDCTDHEPEQCCHCKASPYTIGAILAPLPPVDIERRLNGDGPVKVLKEPGMANGRYDGPKDGPGRGELTTAQRVYLVFIRDMHDRAYPRD